MCIYFLTTWSNGQMVYLIVLIFTLCTMASLNKTCNSMLCNVTLKWHSFKACVIVARSVPLAHRFSWCHHLYSPNPTFLCCLGVYGIVVVLDLYEYNTSALITFFWDLTTLKTNPEHTLPLFRIIKQFSVPSSCIPEDLLRDVDITNGGLLSQSSSSS